MAPPTPQNYSTKSPPAENQTPMSSPKLTAKQKIQQLANQHSITHHHTQQDEWGNTISQLSDSEVELDETQWLLIELGRAGILTGKDNTLLHAQYLKERTV